MSRLRTIILTKHIDEMVLTGTNKVNFFQQFIKTYFNYFLLNKVVNFIYKDAISKKVVNFNLSICLTLIFLA